MAILESLGHSPLLLNPCECQHQIIGYSPTRQSHDTESDSCIHIHDHATVTIKWHFVLVRVPELSGTIIIYIKKRSRTISHRAWVSGVSIYVDPCTQKKTMTQKLSGAHKTGPTTAIATTALSSFLVGPAAASFSFHCLFFSFLAKHTN